MQTVLGSFLFFVLLRTGTSLECEVCNGMGTSCTGPMESCEAGQDTCAIILTENSLAGENIQTVMKQCDYSTVCSSPTTYMNMGQGRHVRTSITCCVGDACQTTSPQKPQAFGKGCDRIFPPHSTFLPFIATTNERSCRKVPPAIKPNGKQCPACYSFSASGCDTVTTECAGEEDYCLNMVQKITYGKFVLTVNMKGCATENVCATNEGEAVSGGIHTNIMKVSCTPATIAA